MTHGRGYDLAMTSLAAASSTRSATPWATLLVAVIVAELLQMVSILFSLVVLPATMGDLATEIDATEETAEAAARIALLQIVPWLVLAALFVLLAAMLLLRLVRSGRSVHWGVALAVGTLTSVPVGIAIFFVQWPIALAIRGVLT